MAVKGYVFSGELTPFVLVEASERRIAILLLGNVSFTRGCKLDLLKGRSWKISPLCEVERGSEGILT